MEETKGEKSEGNKGREEQRVEETKRRVKATRGEKSKGWRKYGEIRTKGGGNKGSEE